MNCFSNPKLGWDRHSLWDRGSIQNFNTHLSSIPGCAFGAILNLFMKGSLVKGPNICAKMSIFWQFMTWNIEFLTKNTLLGNLSCQKIWKCVIFQKKKPLREHPTGKSSLKVIFWGFDMSKIIEMCHFSEKKAPAGASDRQK